MPIDNTILIYDAKLIVNSRHADFSWLQSHAFTKHMKALHKLVCVHMVCPICVHERKRRATIWERMSSTAAVRAGR